MLSPLALLTLLSPLWSLGCTPEADDTGGPATVTLLSPADGATVCGSPLQVQVEVTGITLVTPTGDAEDAEPGTGHVDVSLNGQDAAMAWTEDITLSEIGDGAYQLKVELSNADHTAIEPYAGDFAYITVDDTACD